MLEGAVARLLNQLLGKYVVDLDTENLNVGIFSGHVQLTDLKLKTEALYELNLPIEVIAGTISKIWLQIPWTSLWSQPVVINIEDVHIIAGPIVTYGNKYDEEKNKRLLRAFKRKAIQDLNDEYELIGGPAHFREYLFSSILNNLQLNITNVHIRYEDRDSTNFPLAAGICIGNITAETTNSKWKPSKQTKSMETSFYLVKIEAFSMYWNPKYNPIDWDLPSQYYNWRNTMSNSLKNYSLNDQNFEFVLKPMTIKVKTTIQKSISNNNSHIDKDNGYIAKISSDVIIQDCNLQMTKLQYQSILATYDALQRMYTTWHHLSLRPHQRILAIKNEQNANNDLSINSENIGEEEILPDNAANVKSWWKYAYLSCLEQRVRPYYWNRIRNVREYYRNYCEIYKKILLNPKDTELKLDLQQYEDKLSVVNIVIARQHTRLLVHSTSLSEKSFWDILPSPERTLLCDKIGYAESERAKSINHNYNFRIGNISLTLYDSGTEIFILTLTQLISSFQPYLTDKSFMFNVKVEALIVDGINAGGDEPLVTLISSQHMHNSPAYFFKFNLEKTPLEKNCDYRLNGMLESLEIVYNETSIKAFKSFLNCNEFTFNKVISSIRKTPEYLFANFKDKIRKLWDINLDLKIPHLVLPENGTLQTNSNLLIIDCGHVIINTELMQEGEISENATQMELEEQLYSRLYLKCDDTQLLFCDRADNWKDARKEKDTDLHLISKFNYAAIYGSCVKTTKTLPKEKFNMNLTSIKCNLSERKIGKFLNYLNSINSLSLFTLVEEIQTKSIQIYLKDKVTNRFKLNYLNHVQNAVNVTNMFVNKSRRAKQERSGSLLIYEKRKMSENMQRENMNEVWARTVDLPGLEDNISPNNNIDVLLRFVVNEFQLVLSRSNDKSDRDYLMLRLGCLTMDIALMTYGPAFQLNVNSVLVTDKLHTTPSGQYLDLIHSPVPSTTDVLTILYRKVSANCPDFWTHFHAVETSLVADFGTLNVMLHQESVHTIIKYTRYVNEKIKKQLSDKLLQIFRLSMDGFNNILKSIKPDVPVPPGSVKFSHSARLSDLNVRICDSDFDFVNVHLSGLEMDFLFKANERFVFRSFLSNLNVEHLSDVSLYPKVFSTDEDKVFEVKYVRYANLLQNPNEISTSMDETVTGGSFKFHLGQIHVVFLYKLIVQLHRFVMNLDISNIIEDLANYTNLKISRVMETFKSNTKIHLAINIKGPIVLFPQKSSSPNLLVFDIGALNVENFFKEYPNEYVENILLKLEGITITRGVMTLTSTMVMQEVIIEPLGCHIDIKRYVPQMQNKQAVNTGYVSTKRLNWDIDGVMDTIQITLGQKDLTTLLSIYTDNISEGKLLDLFPTAGKSVTPSTENDDTVKTLEAFFCEPKQKDISVKFSFDGLSLLLFFDSGEMLSSPIRDLNHGLCKLDVVDMAMSFVVYTDKSLDGKLSIDMIQIEEIGPDANVYDKSILQSPIDDNKNNNCHITVNKPPIIDVTFHKNKTSDKSIDIIIGRLNLSLSVPFCEKLAMFILECVPKDVVGDTGIINQGYVADNLQEYDKCVKSSLTVALRINRPEFTFVIETTSNKKRYFITKTEILLDYSRHIKMLNFVISLSGLHSLFYDFSLEPYTILKQCDVEISKSYNEEKGTKITAVISSIYIQICNRIVYNVNDILNDIIEHFKVPENEDYSRKNSASQDFYALEPRKISATKPKKDTKVTETTGAIRKNSRNSFDYNDLWSPCKIINYETFDEALQSQQQQQQESCDLATLHEIFLLQKAEIVVVLELEDVPVLLFKSTLEATMYDWSSLLNCTCELTLQTNYYNDNLQQWEPFVDPIVVDNNEFKPWEVTIKVFQDKSIPMLTNDGKTKKETKKRKNFNSFKSGDNGNEADADDDDEISEDDMVYLEPSNTFLTRNTRIKTSLSTFLDDTDSENEDGTMEKLAAAISDLFTGDWNESDCSESDYSSDGDEDTDDNIIKKEQQEIPEEPLNHYKKAIYILVDSKEVLNVTITPSLLKVLNELFTIYSNKTLSIINSNLPAVNLTNDIGPKTKVELYEKKSKECSETSQNNNNSNNGSNADESVLLCSKTYENQDSCTNSPTKSVYYSYDYNGTDVDDKDSYTDDISKIDIELGYDDETTSSLLFPNITTSYLYEKINKNHLKIHIPGFQSIQTCCPKKSWQKLIKLHPVINNQLYYIIAKHTIGKHGRSVSVNSPLQISNETCFALSVLYQPSVLQQLNLEPVGDVTNPFETTMRIAVLEPHEQYNVPLFIAYHSKLFIQPAYAEGHYASDNGIWWKDLSTDLDVAHNFHCKPKSQSNLEVFSLRLMLKKNFKLNTSHIHSIPNYVIYLLPPLILHNFLPYSLEVQNVYLKQQMKIEPGEQTSIYSLNLSKDQKLLIKISYANLLWSGMLNLTTHLDEKIINLTSDCNKSLSINVKTDREGSCNIYFYTPYWIVNKTTLPLYIKGSSTNIIHESATDEILLFTYKRHGKQMLNMKVYESDWSNDFGLDCLGTTGLVVCKDNVRRKRYTFLVSIRLSELCPKYTKLIFILPNFIVANNTNKNLRFMEHNEKTDLWIDINPNNSLPFWPETTSMQMYIKYRDSKLNSQAFYISTTHHTVLRMDKGGALCVDVTGGKNESFFVTFNEYKEGDAPIFIKNLCPDLFLKIQQQGQSQVTLLSPFNGLMYTWDDPTKPRQLLWNVYNNKGSGFLIDISKDSYGEEKINFHSISPNQLNQTATASISSSDDSDTGSTNSENSAKILNASNNTKKIRKCKIIIYWICYRNGKQRTLMFTQQQRNHNQLVKDIFMEHCDLDCLFSLSGIGMSLFTDRPRKEYIYLSIAEVPAIWEVNVGHKWKQLTLELASWIEDKYKLNYKKCQLKDYIQIDFEKMFMIKPFFAELKRTYNPAIYAQYRKSNKHKYYNMKLQQLQIDNKDTESTATSVVLSVLPKLPLDTYKYTTTPFIEVNCLRFNWKNCNVYKNVHCNISDFYLNIDYNLIANVANLLLNRFKFNQDELGFYYRKDMNTIRSPMRKKEKTTSRTIIENVHVSQFSVQIYVSGGNTNNIKSCPITNFVYYFYPSNLSAYMPAEGVKHKITPLEQTDLKTNFANVLIEILDHVRVQFLQQYYSQVMGLQVLVNPYANQIIPCNEKIPNDGDKVANITLFACRCLLGHLNMSSAALEQCIMDIFSNQTIENIQRTRRHGSYQKSSGLPKNITSVSKRFNPGVILALNQIIVKNVTANVQCDGERFFKGTGKALLSLITRHPDEKSDSVQVAIEALKRAVILGEPITIHQRLTRYFNAHLGLKPFSMYESMGQHLLEILANCRFSTDNYWSHALLDKQGKSIVIVTLEHIIKINKCRLWGPWELEWCVDLDEIISVPKVTTNELIINMRQAEINPNNAAGKLTILGDKETLAWLKEKIGQAIVVSMEQKSWIIQ